jgi:Tat-targeted selenate reductase subunit YnfF
MDTVTGKAQMIDVATTDPSLRGKEHFDFKNRKRANMPNDWRDLQPIAVYRPCYNGMEDFPAGRLKSYPLMLLTPNTRHRIHYFMGDPGHARMTQCLRHSLIISPTDAKARGIKDNDLVRVWNDQGQSLVPAHVTNRMMPGVVQLRTGVVPAFTRSGGGTPQSMDLNGCANIFTGGDDVSPVTPSKVTNLVDVEKYGEGKVY